MFESAIQMTGGDVDKGIQILQVNRTGGTTVANAVYVRDFRQDNAASTTVNLGRGNMVAAATANLMMPPVVNDVIDTQVAAGVGVLVTAAGPCKALVNGAVAKGDFLKTVNAQTYFTKATFGVGSVEFAWAIALDTQGAVLGTLNVFLLGVPVTQNAAVS